MARTGNITGAAELRAGLLSLGDEVATRVGQAANNRAAKVAAAAVRARAPVSDVPNGATYQRKTNSGSTTVYHRKIRDEIKVRKQKARKQGYVVSLITTGLAFHSKFVEFGTVKMAARPFMRPALDASTAAVFQAQQDELSKGITRAAKKIKKARQP